MIETCIALTLLFFGAVNGNDNLIFASAIYAVAVNIGNLKR